MFLILWCVSSLSFTFCCSHSSLVSKCLIFPSPAPWIIALAVDESVNILMSSRTPRSLSTLRRPRACAAHLFVAYNSASPLLRDDIVCRRPGIHNMVTELEDATRGALACACVPRSIGVCKRMNSMDILLFGGSHRVSHMSSETSA